MGLFVPVWSPWIIGELYRVLTWDWAKENGVSNIQRHRCSESADKMMAHLEPYWTLTSSAQPWPATWPELHDQWDIPILATAITGHARYVVSDNTEDFPPANADGHHVFRDIEYVPSRVFLYDILRL